MPQDASRQLPTNACTQQQSPEKQAVGERSRNDASQGASRQLSTTNSFPQQQSPEKQAVRERDRNDASQDASRQLSTMNSCTQQQSPEQRTFRESYDILQDVFLHSLDLDFLANKLYAQRLITKNTHSKVQSQHYTEQRKCTLLLAAVDNLIKYNPRKFHDFLELLSEDSAMEDVLKRIHDTYEQQASPDAGQTKLPNFFNYTEPFSGGKFNDRCNKYRKAIMSSNSWEVESLITEDIMNGGEIELKAFFLCYNGLVKATVPYQLDKAERILQDSLTLADQARESHNGQLLRGRAYRILAGVFRRKRNYKQGLEIIEKGKDALQLAEPSCETACLLMEEALLQQLSDKRTRKEQEQTLKLALNHARFCKDHQRARYTVSHVYLRLALFYLDAFEEKKQASPLPENLRSAEDCLKLVELNVVGGANVYEMEYYVAYSCLSSYRQNPTEALRCARKAEDLLHKSGIANDSYLHVRKRLEVLEKSHVIPKGRETQV